MMNTQGSETVNHDKHEEGIEAKCYVPKVFKDNCGLNKCSDLGCTDKVPPPPFQMANHFRWNGFHHMLNKLKYRESLFLLLSKK